MPGLFYEYAITPDVFDPSFLTGDGAHLVTLIQVLRGILDNGVISDLNESGWSEEVARRLKGEFSQMSKTDLMTLLNVLKNRNRLVWHPKTRDNPSDELEWLELAREAHGRAPLDAIMLTPELLGRSGMDDELLVDASGALNSLAWFARRKSKTIKKQEEGYRCLLSKILRHAKRLYLIDPYFRPDQCRWTDTIKICASLMGQRGFEPLPGTIEIHTGAAWNRSSSDRRTRQEEEKKGKEWKKWLTEEFAPNYAHNLSVSMWKNRQNGERLHDRFLITDQVGFSIPGGLECLRPQRTPSETTWTLLEEDDRRLWLDKFREGTSPYELLCRVAPDGSEAH